MNAMTVICIVLGATVIGVAATFGILAVGDFFANGCERR